jgi:undecaprenyl-diphosphatase
MRTPELDRIMVFITSWGNAGFLWIVIGFLLLLIKQYQKCGFTLLCAYKLSTYLGETVIKPLIGRVRPCNRFPDIPLLIHAPHSPSFPSGHTMVGFSCATVIFYFDRRLGILSYIIAFSIAFSRLYLFVHYPTDVLGGIYYGVLCAWLLLLGMRTIYRCLRSGKII